jgi:ATP-binding cassette subfamily B protein
MLDFIKKYSKKYILLIIISLIFQIIQIFFTLYLPNINAKIINIGILKGNIDYIQNQGFWMMVLVGLQVLSLILTTYINTKISLSMVRDVRKDLYYKIHSFSSADINKFGAATLITRSTNDLQNITFALNFFFSMIISLPITIIGSITLAISQSLSLSTILILMVVIFIPIVTIFTKKLKPLFELFQKQFDSINTILKDQITGVQVVKAFVKEKIEYNRFKKAGKKLYDLNMGVGNLLSIFIPLFMILPNFLILLTMLYGATLINSGELNIGSLTAFITYLFYIFFAIMASSMVIGYLPQIRVSINRVSEVLNTETTILSPSKPINIKDPQGIIEFKNVNFTYSVNNLSINNSLNNNKNNNNSLNNNRNVLEDINFIAKPSETTGIIGNTASGKSTLLNLIPRFYDVTGGAVFFDGVDIRNLDISRLNSYISFTPQKSFLFNGTIAENLRLGKNDANEDELWEALEIAQIADFVSKLDGGLEFEISQNGSNLSGGQKQRLSIARAILPKPKVLIFDDTFSALDYVTDFKLRTAIAKNIKNITVIIVSQRISTIRKADNIIVMDNGKIVSQGKHDDLIKNCEIYKSIVSSQAKLKEDILQLELKEVTGNFNV